MIDPTTFTAPSIDRLVHFLDRGGAPDVTKPSDELACVVEWLPMEEAKLL